MRWRIMPKRIENLQETILQISRKIMLEEDYSALTIRNVARECGIAVGTVYNYYASKDLLAAAVILEDWNEMLAVLGEKCKKAQDMRDGLTIIYEDLNRFSKQYRKVWAGYSYGPGQQETYAARHKMLIRQIAVHTHQLTQRFSVHQNDDMDLFLTENLMLCTGGSEMSFAAFLEIVMRAM